MLRILTPLRHVWDEVVNFSVAASTDHRVAGEFVKIDAAAVADKWRSFVKMGAAEVGDDQIAILSSNTSRPDTGGGVVSGNPDYAFIGSAGTATVVRNWKGMLVITDQVVGTPAVGDELTVVEGKLQATATGQPVHAICLGAAEAHYKVPNGFVVQLAK